MNKYTIRNKRHKFIKKKSFNEPVEIKVKTQKEYIREKIEEEEKKEEQINKEEEIKNKIDKKINMRDLINRLQDIDLSDSDDE